MSRSTGYAVMLALVLANVGYFAWRTWIAPPAAGSVPWRAPGAVSVPAVVPAGMSAIDLAGEVRDDLPAAMPAAPLPVCLQLGPFAEPIATAEALIEIRSRGFAPTVIYPPEVVPRRWVVRIEGLPTEADQERVMARLKAAGFSDFAALPRETRTYAVSLGVFSEPSRAARRSAQMQAAGIAARIVPLYAPVAERWLQVTLDPAVMPAGFAPGTVPTAALAGAWRVRACDSVAAETAR
ncbi:MAG: hypothetical protein NTV91_06575 [Proteobacteria bacterium]|nr:hypothetical protein [Pseudomonadota bacterium]